MAALVAVLLPIGAGVGLASTTGSSDDAAQGRSELDDVAARVDRVTEQLRDARGDVRNARRVLAGLEEELELVEERVNAAAVAVEQQQTEVEQATARLARVRAEADELAEQVEDRAVSMFKHGSASELGTVLAAGDVQEALDRTAYMDLVSGAGRVELETLDAARVAVAAEAERLRLEEERLVELQEREQALFEQVERLRDAELEALGAARARVDSLASRRDQLSSDAEGIEQLIQAGGVAPVAAASSASAAGRGGWIRPICAPVTSNFGYRWGRLHAGMDFGASTGSPIFASRPGQVIHAGWQGGYGNLVLVDHQDGIVTAYAHMSSITSSVGQSVRRGQQLGLVGNTGNSTGPHLHFEVRVNGAAQDPLGFIPGGC